MGQAIVYCAVCNAQLRETDFAKSAAFKFEHKVYCKKCVPANFAPPLIDRPAALKRHGVTTTSGLRAVKAETPRSHPKLIWVAGLLTGSLGVLAALVLFSSRSTPPAPRSEPDGTGLGAAAWLDSGGGRRPGRPGPTAGTNRRIPRRP
jgi:hypothetical protein